MASLVGNRPIQPSQTAERQVDGTNRDTRLALGNVQQNVAMVNAHANALTPSFMPVDELTDLWWPMDDATGTLVARQAVVGMGKDLPLTFGPSVFPGYVSELGGKCLRLYDDTTPANTWARRSVTASPPTYPTASLSLWFWNGIAAAADKYIFGNFSDAGGATHFNIYCTLFSNGLTQFKGFVTLGGAGFSCAAPGEAWVTCGGWHHLGLVATGSLLILYIDGRGISSTNAVGSINWVNGGGSLWNIGASPTAGVNGLPGFMQDVRVHNSPRPKEWFEEAYLRGRGRYFG